MGINPGNPAFALPPAEDDLSREIKDLRREMRENLASVASSFKSTVEQLNAAIAATINAQASVAGVNNSAFTTTSQEFTHVDFTTPSGYTRALVVSNGAFMGYNGSADPDYIYGQIKVSHGWTSGEVYQFAAAGYSASVSVPFYATLYGLVPDEVVTVSAFARTGFGDWPSSVANQVNVYAQVLFLR